MTPTEKAIEAMARAADPGYDHWFTESMMEKALTALIKLHPGIASAIEGADGQYVYWGVGDDTVCMDGDFTAEDLRTIADNMDLAMLAAKEQT